jgi:hypothetical protein
LAFLGFALLLALGFAADALADFGPVLPGAFGAAPAALAALLAATLVTPFTDVPLALRAGVRDVVLPPLRDVVVLARAGDGLIPLADSPLAALSSDLTAVSSALVALVIAASALLSDLADVPALVAAVFSRVAADDTLVAAAETVRGVAAPALLAVVLLVVDRAVVRVLLVTVAGLAAAVRVAGLLAASVVPGTVAVVFVGTDLPLDMDQLRGPHSTESNLLHLATRKNNGRGTISVTLGHFSPCGSSSRTIRSASCGDAPFPTATPIR